jgi:hypothetical protein
VKRISKGNNRDHNVRVARFFCWQPFWAEVEVGKKLRCAEIEKKAQKVFACRPKKRIATQHPLNKKKKYQE